MGEEDEKTLIGDRRAIESAFAKETNAYVIVLAGPCVGEMFRVRSAVVIGRGDSVGIRVPDSEISREHARLSFDADGVTVEDLGSTNGTFVNGRKVTREKLADGDKIQVGTTTILKFSYHDDIEEQFQRQMYESALRDGLTGAHNRKYFQERLDSELAYAKRHRTALSLIMLDLDHFKLVNDAHGHVVGDEILKAVVRLVDEQIRREDLFARFGGEEFALLLRGTDLASALTLAERIRASIEASPVAVGETSVPVTVSIGVASVSEIGTADLVAAADSALYAAKAAGRNRVMRYDP